MRRLKIALLSLAAIELVAGAAMAADLPVKARPIVAPAFSWTGFYVGLNAGYSKGHVSASQNMNGLNPARDVTPLLLADVAAQAQSLDPRTITGGLQVGYNLQFATNLVAGLEADINSFRLNSSFANSVHSITGFPHKTVAETGATTSDWLATVRGRLGYADNRMLAYVTGGAAFTNYNDSRTLTVRSTELPQTDTFTTSAKNQFGWALGAGFEYAWTNQWSIKGEYLHLDFGTKNYIASRTTVGCCDRGMANSSLSVSEKLTAELVRLGINYKFAAR